GRRPEQRARHRREARPGRCASATATTFPERQPRPRKPVSGRPGAPTWPAANKRRDPTRTAAQLAPPGQLAPATRQTRPDERARTMWIARRGGCYRRSAESPCAWQDRPATVAVLPPPG